MRTAIAAVLLCTSTFATAASSRPQAPPPGTPARILVAFKLDPRLSGPTYGGHHWVSPPTFRGASAQDTVDVRAAVTDAKGRALKATPQWKPSDPEMVSVLPARGDLVTIAVKRAGESSVTVVEGAVSRTLRVKAQRSSGSLQVSITQ